MRNSGAVGMFVIISESSVSAGTRRIEAITGENAYSYLKNNRELIKRMSNELKTRPENLESRLKNLLSNMKEMEREIRRLKTGGISRIEEETEKARETIGGIDLFIWYGEGAGKDELGKIADRIRDKYPNALILMGGIAKDGSISLIGSAGPGALEKGLNAGKIVSILAREMGGGGGGKPSFGQGKGKNTKKVHQVFEQIKELISKEIEYSS